MKPSLTIKIAAPRGFCAGVTRAIQIVEAALKKFGTPIYVRHQIVHNKFVVDSLKAKGAIFIEELNEAPEGSTVIFSAHGVSKSVHQQSDSRNMISIDATCPLVKKVHKEVQRFAAEGKHVIVIGHKNHAEIIGTMGQVDPSSVSLVQTPKDVEALEVHNPDELAYCTQTTLSIDQTRGIIEALQNRFPNIISPNKADICYATTNRQDAVKKVAPQVDAMIVIGSENSSNSKRLVEVAKSFGCAKSILLDRVDQINWKWLGQPQSLGITAGASVPEILVTELITSLKERFDVSIEEVRTADETMEFAIPANLK